MDILLCGVGVLARFLAYTGPTCYLQMLPVGFNSLRIHFVLRKNTVTITLRKVVIRIKNRRILDREVFLMNNYRRWRRAPADTGKTNRASFLSLDCLNREPPKLFKYKANFRPSPVDVLMTCSSVSDSFLTDQRREYTLRLRP